MGFDLSFSAISNGTDSRDADREGLSRFLAARGLTMGPDRYGMPLVDAAGEDLELDGRWADLHLSEREGHLRGSLGHATLSAAECEFIVDLCTAARWLVVNPQGDPMLLVPRGTHAPSDLPDDCTMVWVENGTELREALLPTFGGFLAFLDEVLRSPDNDHPQDR